MCTRLAMDLTGLNTGKRSTAAVVVEPGVEVAIGDAEQKHSAQGQDATADEKVDKRIRGRQI